MPKFSRSLKFASGILAGLRASYFTLPLLERKLIERVAGPDKPALKATLNLAVTRRRSRGPHSFRGKFKYNFARKRKQVRRRRRIGRYRRRK